MAERPSWFWGVVILFILAWIVAGTQTVIYIINGEVLVAEALIIITTVILVIFFYIFQRLATRRNIT